MDCNIWNNCMDTLLKIKTGKPRNFVAMDLRTPKYRMKVAQSKKLYNRQSEKLLTKRNKNESF
jgi:hypothetical protein